MLRRGTVALVASFSCFSRKDAGVLCMLGPRLKKPEHGGPAEPTERQQPEHGYEEQVPGRGHGGTEPGPPHRAERALLQ